MHKKLEHARGDQDKYMAMTEATNSDIIENQKEK